MRFDLFDSQKVQNSKRIISIPNILKKKKRVSRIEAIFFVFCSSKKLFLRERVFLGFKENMEIQRFHKNIYSELFFGKFETTKKGNTLNILF